MAKAIETNTAAWTHEDVVAYLNDFAATAKPAKVAKIGGATKKQAVLNMVTEQAVKAEAIAEALGITLTAARSLIGDLRRAGLKVEMTAEGYKLAA